MSKRVAEYTQKYTTFMIELTLILLSEEDVCIIEGQGFTDANMQLTDS